MFRALVRAADGKAYEDLFVNVMGYYDEGFRPVKPQGAIGDRKNDGFNSAKGRYFQVFAPEEPGLSAANGAKKAREDFAGLHEHWNQIAPIKEFYFVFNDKFDGAYPEIEQALADIKVAHSLSECKPFLASNLEEALFSLQDDIIVSIVGPSPDPSRILLIDYSVLSDIVTHIMETEAPDYGKETLKAPDFFQKIEFNGLTKNVETMLTRGSFHAGVIESFFREASQVGKQLVRDELNKKYTQLKQANREEAADTLFFNLLSLAAPSNQIAVVDATCSVLAYFFESCDIFEEPENGFAR